MKQYTIVLRQDLEDPQKRWLAEVPAIPWCFSFGDTQAEAEANIRDALALALEVMEARGEPFPEDVMTRHIEAEPYAA